MAATAERCGTPSSAADAGYRRISGTSAANSLRSFPKRRCKCGDGGGVHAKCTVFSVSIGSNVGCAAWAGCRCKHGGHERHLVVLRKQTVQRREAVPEKVIPTLCGLGSEAEAVTRAKSMLTPSMDSSMPDSDEMRDAHVGVGEEPTGVRRHIGDVLNGVPVSVRKRLEYAMDRDIAAFW